MTFGSRTMSAGLPSTSTLPRSSTMARSTSGITISITCSTINTVTPVARTRRTSSTPVWASIGVRPGLRRRNEFAGEYVGARRQSRKLQHLIGLGACLAHLGGADQRADDDV